MQLQTLISYPIDQSLQVAPSLAQAVGASVLTSVLEQIESDERNWRFMRDSLPLLVRKRKSPLKLDEAHSGFYRADNLSVEHGVRR